MTYVEYLYILKTRLLPILPLLPDPGVFPSEPHIRWSPLTPQLPPSHELYRDTNRMYHCRILPLIYKAISLWYGETALDILRCSIVDEPCIHQSVTHIS